MKFIRFAIAAFLAYLIAAPLTSTISMDLSQTQWASLWTYFFWAFGLFIWIAIIGICSLIFVALINFFDH
ncbi:MAG: hypothetical protein GXP16_09060 [Gammaproteobacteria bacterium]|nr:hypothetical protein [Gammaproteobacteria bacterium]